MANGARNRISNDVYSHAGFTHKGTIAHTSLEQSARLVLPRPPEPVMCAISLQFLSETVRIEVPGVQHLENIRL